jgi:galactarate dehydratase
VAAAYIRVHESDDVAIVVDPEGAAAGSVTPSGLRVREWIPQSHKIALNRLETGQPVLRYGQVIGYANRAIEACLWVREDFLELPAAPPLDQMPLSTAVPVPLPPLDNFEFLGYRNGH